MFNIEELRVLCDRDFGTFYLSPLSTYEFIIYGDIDHFEILIEEPLEEWLKKQKRIEYQYKNDGLVVFFKEELFEVYVSSLEGSIVSYLDEFDFNICGVSIRISDDDRFKTFACYKEKYCASWVDPYSLRPSIKNGLIKPIHLEGLSQEGHKIFAMLSKMVDYNLDLDQETIEALKLKTFVLDEDVDHYFFNILTYRDSVQYVRLLDELGLLELAFPTIKKMKTKGVWFDGLKSLEKLEALLNTPEGFSDGVNRIISEELRYTFDCGLNKYQLLKFSVLFYQAYQVMLLRQNAPERYEEPYTSFCNNFGFCEEACGYYSLMIKSSQDLSLNMKDRVSLERQYEFYDEYRNHSIDVLVIYLIKQMNEEKELYINRFEYMIKKYISKYCELQSINGEITTLDISRHELSDVKLTLLIEKVKEKIFFGNLRYDRKTIINYLQKLIEQSN